MKLDQDYINQVKSLELIQDYVPKSGFIFFLRKVRGELCELDELEVGTVYTEGELNLPDGSMWVPTYSDLINVSKNLVMLKLSEELGKDEDRVDIDKVITNTEMSIRNTAIAMETEVTSVESALINSIAIFMGLDWNGVEYLPINDSE